MGIRKSWILSGEVAVLKPGRSDAPGRADGGMLSPAWKQRDTVTAASLQLLLQGLASGHELTSCDDEERVRARACACVYACP